MFFSFLSGVLLFYSSFALLSRNFWCSCLPICSAFVACQSFRMFSVETFSLPWPSPRSYLSTFQRGLGRNRKFLHRLRAHSLSGLPSGELRGAPGLLRVSCGRRQFGSGCAAVLQLRAFGGGCAAVGQLRAFGDSLLGAL